MSESQRVCECYCTLLSHQHHLRHHCTITAIIIITTSPPPSSVGAAFSVYDRGTCSRLGCRRVIKVRVAYSCNRPTGNLPVKYHSLQLGSWWMGCSVLQYHFYSLFPTAILFFFCFSSFFMFRFLSSCPISSCAMQGQQPVAIVAAAATAGAGAAATVSSQLYPANQPTLHLSI